VDSLLCHNGWHNATLFSNTRWQSGKTLSIGEAFPDLPLVTAGRIS
jgi:hypothetical protein